MKVLHVIDSLNAGGAERVCVDLVNLLVKEGEDVTLLLFNEEGPLAENLHPSVTLLKLNRGFKFNPLKLIKLSVIMKSFEVVHVHMRHNFRYVALTNMVQRKRKIILHDHSPLVDGDNKSVPFGLDSFAKPPFYIGVSEALTLWAEEHLMMPHEKIFLLENTITRKPFTGPENGAKGLVHVSNIKPGKNHEFVLEVIKGTSRHVTFYGGVQDNSFWEQLKKKIEHENMGHQVKFIFDVNEIQSILPKYRLGLHASTFESGPLVLIEYLAQYLPFIAYRTGNVSQKLSKEFPEYFMDNLDPESWRDRIDTLLALPVDREKMDAVFLNFFASDIYLNQCLHIYRSALNY